MVVSSIAVLAVSFYALRNPVGERWKALAGADNSTTAWFTARTPGATGVR
jgi:hypothetical protein